jgi:hypothetical protein
MSGQKVPQAWLDPDVYTDADAETLHCDNCWNIEEPYSNPRVFVEPDGRKRCLCFDCAEELFAKRAAGYNKRHKERGVLTPAVGCLYDWKKNASNVLVCQVCPGPRKHGVIRWLSLGHDLLAELFVLGKLTGKALADARKQANSGRQFEFAPSKSHEGGAS